MASNPIIRRELVGLLRKPQTGAIFLALAVVLVGVVIVMWPDDATVTVAAVGGSQAQDIFQATTYGLLVALLLAVPAFPATAIVRERNDGTLALLLTSPLKPISILAGKLSASLAFVLILLAVSVPAVMACFVMGGIDPDQVLLTFGMLALAAAEFSVIALLVSSYARSADSSLRVTYALTLTLTLLVMLPYMLLQGQPLGIVIDVLGWLYCLSPLAAINQLTGQQDVASLGTLMQFNAVQLYTLSAVVIILATGLWLIGRLNSRLLDRTRATGQVTDERSAGARVGRRIMFLGVFDPSRREQSIGFQWKRILAGIGGAVGFGIVAYAAALAAGNMGLFEGAMAQKLIGSAMVAAPALIGLVFALAAAVGLLWGSPVVVKELLTRMMGRAHWMMRLIGLCLVVSLLLTLAAAQWTSASPEKIGYLGGALVIFQMALIILITPALSAALISAERESGAWQLLQSTPLRPIQIVLGKLLSVVSTIVLLLLATLPGYVVLVYVDESFIPRVKAVLITLGLTALFALMLGAACSSVLRKTAATTAAAYLLLIVLCIGTMLAWLAEGALLGTEVVHDILTFNPLAAALALMQVPGFDRYDLTPGNWQFLAIGSAVLGMVLWARTWWLTRPE